MPLLRNAGAKSPWPGPCPPPAAAERLGGIATECFTARTALLDDAGHVSFGPALQTARATQWRGQVFVVCFADRSCVAGSVPEEVRA